MFLEEVPFPFDDPSKHKFIQIDEEGRFLSDGVRFADETYCAELLKNLVRDPKNRFFVKTNEFWVIVEPFDEPYVAEMVQTDEQGKWSVLLPYDLKVNFELESLSIDEWDRFHGLCENQIPFVLSRKAQAAFFDQLDSFTDTSITFKGQTIELSDWLIDDSEKDKEEFWTGIYLNEPQPKFDLGEAAKGLVTALPQLKLTKSRIAVPGAGKGHDAAHLAEQGHLVTAFDVSPEAIKEMQAKYGHIKTLSFELLDIFNPPEKLFGQFDVIFEHTLYCAVAPSRRTELMNVWKKLLTPEGFVLGVFFAMDKRMGPPYGGTEWELRQRFKDHFDFYYWTRLKTSLARRLGKEILVYMKKNHEEKMRGLFV